MRNDGNIPWPNGSLMAFSSGDMKGDAAQLPPLQPGKEFEV